MPPERRCAFAVLTAFLGMLGTVCVWGLGGCPSTWAPGSRGWKLGAKAAQEGGTQFLATLVHRGNGGTSIILLGTCPEKENSEMPNRMSQLKQEAFRTPSPSFVFFPLNKNALLAQRSTVCALHWWAAP